MLFCPWCLPDMGGNVGVVQCGVFTETVLARTPGSVHSQEHPLPDFSSELPGGPEDLKAFDKPTGKSLHAPPSRTVSTCTWDRSMADLGTSSASFDGASAQDPVSIDVQPLEFMLGQPEEFTEYLIKGGKTLGVSLSYGKHDDFLLITKIGDGLVQELNDRGACQIRVFDAIVQVNGVRDDAAEMLDRLSKADALELVLVRYVGEEQLDGLLSKQQPDAGPGAPSTAPRPPSAALPRMLSEQYTLSIGQPWPHEKLPRLLSEQ